MRYKVEKFIASNGPTGDPPAVVDLPEDAIPLRIEENCLVTCLVPIDEEAEE